MSVPSHLAGQKLGHYRILAQIGAGGMGVVYRARDERLYRDVALKVLPPRALADENARKRFRKEALNLSKLSDPNIAHVYDFDTQNGIDFLVMEYVDGVTLAEKIAKVALHENEVLSLGEQIARALEDVHERGIVHRDLKPGNIMVTTKGQVKLLDFGLARLLRANETDATESITEMHQAAGTLPYMAPEQLLGAWSDFRSDIYAAGAVLYEMATGHRPFETKLSTALADEIIHGPPASPRQAKPDLSTGLEYIILKCLEKEPENRYQSARDLDVDLRRLRTPTTAPVAMPAARARTRLRRIVTATGITVVSVLAVLFGLNVGRWRERGLGRRPSIHSIAVLPLVNFSLDPEQEYFADGMTEELISDLAKIRALRVISRTSAMQYKKAHKSLPKIAEELNVDAVVEGTVARSGDRVRITAQLIQAENDKNLWAQSYDRDLRDVLALQSEVAQSIAHAIQITLTPQEQARLEDTRPVNPEAHEAYLKGRYYWNKRTPEGVQKGLEYFQQAIHTDPAYAPAYAGLADCYDLLGTYRVLPPKEALQKAKTAAIRALELDDKLAEAHASLAAIKFLYLEWDGVEKEFQRAIEVDPGYATAHHWYALFLAATARNQEALAEIKLAQRLDPLSLIINANVGWCLYLGRDYDQAIEQLQKALELDPNFPAAYEYLGQAYLEKGMYEEAIATLRKAMSLSRNEASLKSELGNAYAAAGKKEAAIQILHDLLVQSSRTYVSPYDIAFVYAGLGDKDKLFQWLNKAAEDRSTALAEIKVHPRFDKLRKDPRFQDLLRRLGLPETDGGPQS